MTLKTSFFNKAVYKSTLKRFAWGSVLYFAFLFITIIINVSVLDSYNQYYSVGYGYTDTLLLSNNYLLFPILLTIVIPTVTSLLIFRFQHSRKQIIFIHSSPVSRRANYISSVLAGLTLMILPVLVSALIYLFYFKPVHCFMWLGINVFSIFIMFSISVFSSVITGNSFAAVVINIIFHSIAAIILSSFELIAEGFVYGFSSSVDLWNIISENNFVVVILGLADNFFRDNLSAWEYVKFIGTSLVIYALSYYAYKLRKSETASDVAGFKVLNYIFKYLVTFLFTLLTFAVFGQFISSNILVFIIILFIFSLISYFGTEMLLKKSVNVISSYKGYIGYVIALSVIMIIFSCTSFFGYETRIPERNDIKEVCVYEYYYNATEPYTTDSDSIDDAILIHSKLTANIPVIHPDRYDTRIHIKYRLKNGKTLLRTYPVTSDERDMIMNTMFENAAYKMKSRPEFTDDDKILKIDINNEEIKDKAGFMKALREDVMNMSYSELTQNQSSSGYHAEIAVRRDVYGGGYGAHYHFIDITKLHTNTLKWIEENIISETAE